MIRVTQTQAAHFVLQKNYLAGEATTGVTQLVDELGGLPSPLPTTPFLSMAARQARFKPDHLLVALYHERRLIKGNLMRNVNYVVPVEEYASLHQATWRQRNQALNAEFRLWDIENSEIERLSEAILRAIDDQPATMETMAERLPPNTVRELTQTSRGGRVSTTTTVELALRWLTARGDLWASQPMPAAPKDWRTEEPAYAPLNFWYPGLELSPTLDEAEAQARLVRTYLSAFGPCTEADISFWTGFGKSETARATNALGSETMLTMVEGIPGMLLSLKTQAEALKAIETPPEPIINILPADDPFTTAYRASRSRYFGGQKLQRHVFSSSGAAKPAIVANGQIVGVWEWHTEAGQDKLIWRLLVEVDPIMVPLIQTEMERVAAFIQPDTLIEQVV